MRVLPPLLLGCVATLGLLRAQESESSDGTAATLLTVTDWVWQCEPIRCTLRVSAPASDVRVRPLYSRSTDPLTPLQVERRQGDEDRWVPVAPPPRQREHPSRYLTSPAGLEIGKGKSYDFEVELWDLAVVSQPGTIRMRFLLEAGTGSGKDAVWSEVATPWAQFEIRAHEGNAAWLLGDDGQARRNGLDRLEIALNSTFATASNRGPANLGPTGASARSFEPFVPLAEELIADAKLSWRLRARARLVLAYDAIGRALRAKGVDRDAVREAALSSARAHLGAAELVASPPSGGLDALPSGGLAVLQQLLIALADGLEGRADARVAYAELAAHHPWFATAWRAEAVDLLQLLRR